MIIDNPEDIDLYSIMAKRSALVLEMLGIKMNKGGMPTAYSVIKKEYNLKGSKQRVWDTFKELIETTKQTERE